jgi:hypothetical protein
VGPLRLADQVGRRDQEDPEGPRHQVPHRRHLRHSSQVVPEDLAALRVQADQAVLEDPRRQVWPPIP